MKNDESPYKMCNGAESTGASMGLSAIRHWHDDKAEGMVEDV